MINRLVRVKLWTQSLEALMLPTTWSTNLYTAIRNASWQRRHKPLRSHSPSGALKAMLRDPKPAYEY